MKPYLLLLGLLWCFFPQSGNAQLVSQVSESQSEGDSKQAQNWTERGLDYWHARQNDSAIWAFKQALACDIPDTTAYVAYRYIGDSYYRMQEFESAMLSLENAEATYPRLPQSHQKYRRNILDTKGMIFRVWGDYDQALSSFNTCYSLASSTNARIRALINLAQTYGFKGDSEKAQRHYQQALDSAAIGSPLYLPYILNGFAEFSLENRQYPEALRYYREVLKEFTEQPANATQIQGNIAEVYSAMGQNVKAQTAFKKAVQMGHQVLDSTRELGKIYLSQGRHFEKLNQAEKALKSYQSALAQVLPNIDQIDLLSFAAPDTFPSENVIMDALDGKARVFRMLAEQSADAAKYHKLALQHWQWALQCQASLRANYQEHTSKYQLVNETRGLAEPAMEQAWALWQKTEDPKYLSTGFELSERTKASMMLELMRELDLRDFQAIPSGERSVWDSLQTELANVERELIVPQAGTKPKDLENQRFALKQAIIRLEKDWEQQYPDYQAAKNDLRTRSLQEIQAQMPPQKAMLTYSIGEVQSFVWLISAKQVIWQALDINGDLNEQIVKFREGLEIGAVDLDQQAYGLYQKLLEPLAKPLAGIKQLIIVPDQAMALLPFEALLMHMPKAGEKSFEKPYLLRQFPVSYAFSATLWSEMKASETTAFNPNILAVAPDFPYSPELLAMAQAPDYNPTRACLDPIENLAEIDSLAELSDIITLVGKQATREQLLAQLEQYAFVHIATHAMADDKDPSKTFLVLREEGSEIEICNETYQDLTALYMNELLHHRIGAEMVVLAACQTGIGKYHHGEGLASLARSFALAGANSVVASLWSVDDRSTRKMMPRFYQYLKEGDSKDVALQKAKIDILEGGLGDPVYWASFIVMGDPAPVEIPDKKPQAWWALLLLVPLMGIIVRRSRKNNKNLAA